MICLAYFQNSLWLNNNPFTPSSYLGNGLMAARLATLGALGAEGTVLRCLWRSSESVLQSLRFLQIVRRGRNKGEMFLWRGLKVLLSNKQFKREPEMNHRRASENVEFWVRVEAVHLRHSLPSQGWSGEFSKLPVSQRCSGMNGALGGGHTKWAGTQMVRPWTFLDFLLH